MAGILRWGRLTRELQEAAALGAFGDGLRLYAGADGSLQLVESVEVVDNAFAHRLEGNKLYPVLADFEGEPVTIGEGTSADDPPAFVELTEAQMVGPTVGYVWASRPSAEEDYVLPAEFRLVVDLPSVESDAVVLFKLVLLVRYGQVLTLEV
ncbi:MAG: hypothetical protein QE274_00355 [Verrucomicrobiaceae bacterium]|nr:hypothetical protein [Verrucomicrobiaceae bacterium]